MDDPAVFDNHDFLDAPSLPPFGLSWLTLAAIFVGGALGTLARYVLEIQHPPGPAGFPWVTLGVNLSGSFLIGGVVVLAEQQSERMRWLRPLVVVGFLGGWTTYSTFAVEVLQLGRHDRVVWAVAYVGATVVGGTVLVVVGHSLGRRLVG